jgi:preprotein translocase subunit YajC
VKQTLLEIEQNIESRKETDKIMWFSMWAVLSVASFGIAWFPMIYFLIKRRNAHFSRQEKLEALILSKLKKSESPEKSQLDSSRKKNHRNAHAWTISTLLIIPAFYIFYFLKSDLRKHEEHEHKFLVEVIELAKDSDVPLGIQGFSTSPSFQLDKYLALSLVTFGLAAAYWLYRIFNDYNDHFKMQWKNEDELLSFLKAVDKESS